MLEASQVSQSKSLFLPLSDRKHLHKSSIVSSGVQFSGLRLKRRRHGSDRCVATLFTLTLIAMTHPPYPLLPPDDAAAAATPAAAASASPAASSSFPFPFPFPSPPTPPKCAATNSQRASTSSSLSRSAHSSITCCRRWDRGGERRQDCGLWCCRRSRTPFSTFSFSSSVRPSINATHAVQPCLPCLIVSSRISFSHAPDAPQLGPWAADSPTAASLPASAPPAHPGPC